MADHDVGASLSKGVHDALRRLAGIAIGPSGVSVELAPDPDVDRGAELRRLLDGAARLARDAGTILLVLVDHLRRAGSTFGERSRPLRLGPLTEGDLRVGIGALVREGRADIDADALALLAERCGGHPYLQRTAAR